MKALVIKGTTLRGKAINEGEVYEMDRNEFVNLNVVGFVVEAPSAVAKPAQPTGETEPTKKTSKRKR